MYWCKSWTIKKAGHCRIEVFELWFWRRLLRFPWIVKRPNQSILKEINFDYSLEGLVLRASLVAQMVKNLPAMWESQVWSLGWEDLLEKVIATHSNILAWRIPWTAEPGKLQSMGWQRVRHHWATNTHTHKHTPIFWQPDANSWLIGKYLDAGKDWGQEKRGMTEDEIVGWYHGLHRHESEQTPGDNEGQGSLACFSPWSCKESDIIGQLNNNIPKDTPIKYLLWKYQSLSKIGQHSVYFPPTAQEEN